MCGHIALPATNDIAHNRMACEATLATLVTLGFTDMQLMHVCLSQTVQRVRNTLQGPAHTVKVVCIDHRRCRPSKTTQRSQGCESNPVTTSAPA